MSAQDEAQNYLYDEQRKQRVVGAFLIMAIAAFFIHSGRAIQSDVAWLLHGAQVLVNGGTFFEDFFETNPPFNTVFYIPVIYLRDWFDVSLHTAFLLYVIPIQLFGLCALHDLYLRYVQHSYEKVDFTSYWILPLAFFLLSFNTFIFVREDLGQRDIFAGLGALIVSGAILIGTLEGKNFLRQYRVAAYCIIGTTLTLLKPHWGALIIMAFAHRLYVQKRLSIIFDLDFLYISLITASYIALSLLFYPGFFLYVLPNVLQFYVPMTIYGPRLIIMVVVMTPMLILGLALLIKDLPLDEEEKYSRLRKHLFFLSCVCFIPALLQFKGLQYHFFWAWNFAGIYIFLFLKMVIASLFSKRLLKKGFAHIFGLLFLVSFLGVLTYSIIETQEKEESFKNSELTTAIQKYTQPDEAYFVMFENMGFIFPLNQYVERPYGSRFASAWFLSLLIDLYQEDPEKAEPHIQFFSKLLADDFREKNTRLVVFQDMSDHPNMEFAAEEGAGFFLEFPKLFLRSQAFQEVWDDYEFVERVQIKRADFRYIHKAEEYGPYATFDLYRRKTTPR